MSLIYPDQDSERDRWILSRRPARNPLDPQRPYAYFTEQERSAEGGIVSVATIFLTNRECPWRCLMCDLWKNTLTEPVAAGSIPAQIDFALERLEAADHIKLYNSGSFFDPHAIPPGDYESIAARLRSFQRVIVESHPALIGESVLRFRDLLPGQLEVAMGLETVQEDVLRKLNKRMTLALFASAAETLRKASVGVRAFILVKPPFTEEQEALYWAQRSIEFAFDCDAGVATLIPVRANNGALESLEDAGQFSPPRIGTLEAALEFGIAAKRGRVFADLWDLRQSPGCCECHPARVNRLHQMNLEQRILEPAECALCRNAID